MPSLRAIILSPHSLPPPRIEWRLAPVYDTRTHTPSNIVGVVLRSVAPYHWTGVARRVAGIHGR